ncbi:TonB-dependent receptor [Niveispirillum sp. KHB5.9]|uniref:TonB-dependent receptor n=1 Tax=Niveispirillum sp. KHB5.9 TaxID=3400269 RepID=UPI003A8A58C2
MSWMNERRRPSRLVLTLLLALAAGDAAHAQSGEMLEEIIVTAEKRSGVADRIGMSIAAFGGEALESLRVTDTKDLVQMVPGFTAADSVAGTPIYTLRGIGFNTPNLSATSPVGVYLNDTALAYPFMTQQMAFDLARVEVLKGPQGTLYGRNTTGGLIKYVTANPGDTYEGALTAGYGNYQSFTMQGHVSAPISETLGIRVAFTAENSDKGWQKSVTHGERLGEKDRLAGRATLQWKPEGGLVATLRSSFWRDRSDTQAPQAIYYLPENPAGTLALSQIAPSLLLDAKNSQADWVPADHPGPRTFSGQRPPYRMNADFQGHALDLEYAFDNGLLLNSSTSYNRVTRDDMIDANGAPFEMLSYQPRGHVNSFSQELRLSGDAERLNWTLGSYYAHDDIFEGMTAWLDDFSTVRVLRAVGAMVPNSYQPGQIAQGLRVDEAVADMKTDSYSLFGSGQYALTDALKLTLGARYNIDRTLFDGCTRDVANNTAPIWNTVVAGVLAGVPANIQPGGCITFNDTMTALSGMVHDRLREDNLSWRAGLDWTLPDGTLLYGTISRGYKSGGFPVIAANTSRQLLPVRQEEVTSYEMGTKLRLLDGALRTSLAAYYSDYRDKQVFGVLTDPLFRTLERVLNVPRSEIWGLEADVNWRLTSGLTARAAASWTQTKVLDYQGFDQFGNAVDFRGSEFPYSPEWQVNAGLDHVTDLSADLSLRSTLSLSYQSRSHGDFQDLAYYTVKSRMLVDGGVTLLGPDERWTAGIWVRNLFNRDYWTSVNYGRDMFSRSAGMPRTYGVNLGWKFG